jgi:hypothetical protein
LAHGESFADIVMTCKVLERLITVHPHVSTT